jgi:ubiquitin carboxyl-terminal hydrolase 10
MLASEPMIYPAEEVQPQLASPVLSDAKLEPVQEAVPEENLHDIVVPSTPTPLASEPESEGPSTQPTTPASNAANQALQAELTPTLPKSRPVAPVVPVIPALPQSPTKARSSQRTPDAPPRPAYHSTTGSQEREAVSADTLAADAEATDESLPPAPKPKPTSWASLLRPAQSTIGPNVPTESSIAPNGALTGRGEALADALNDMNTFQDRPNRISFLQPRGLVNTGNMCYMNSVCPARPST